MPDSPWTPSGEPASLVSPGGTVTLVEGRAFCLSSGNGDIVHGRPEGLFLLDTRLLSRFELRVEGEYPEPLSVGVESPFAAVFAARGRAPEGLADSSLLILRHRYVGAGMREDITLRNFSRESLVTTVSLDIECDFADLFAVKDGRALRDRHTHAAHCMADPVLHSVTFPRSRPGIEARVDVTFSSPPTRYPDPVPAPPAHGPSAQGEDATADAAHTSGRHTAASDWRRRSVTWEIEIPPNGQWSTCVQVALTVGDEAIEPLYACGEEVTIAAPATQLKKWRQEAPIVTCDFHPLEAAVAQAVDDIGSLRIFDPDFPDQPVIAAGAPWFMTLFGRDSIISAWMTLIVDADLSLGVLNALARLQGDKVDERTEEQPGRILHEVRFDRSLSPSLADSSVYYGSIDSTPLFVMLLGELRRWGLARDDVERLLPAADRALEWIHDYGDRDGDGYVEYSRSTPEGLANQGWKDSWDSIAFADGTLAEPPIALAEVQGYVYAAYRARAYFAREISDAETDALYTRRADDLKAAFNRDFWLEDEGYFAIGLDGRKRPIDALASNMGHCLLTGLVEPHKADRMVPHLMSPELFSGWGIRTLATSMARYNPISYHNGSIWPHDNAMIAAGLMRYGYVDEAHRVVTAILEVAEAFNGRLPELFGGLDRSEMTTPLAYPTSCSPQAWAAASPILMLRTLLRLDPWVPFAKVWLDPSLPDRITRMTVEGIPIGSQRVSVTCGDGDVTVEGIAPGVELVREPRPPLGAGQSRSPMAPGT